MAYAQWVVVKILPENCTLQVKNAKLRWGKFHKRDDKNSEVPFSKINTLVATPENPVIISTCGRQNATSGTDGSFELWDGDTHVATYAWICPYGSKTNTSKLTLGTNESYLTTQRGANLKNGALGNLRLSCMRVLEEV